MKVRVIYMEAKPAREFELPPGHPLPTVGHQIVEDDRLYAVGGVRFAGLPADEVVVQLAPIANAGQRFEPKKIEATAAPPPEPRKGTPPKKLGAKA